MNRAALLAGAAVAVILTVTGVAVWSERGRIAEGAARRWLSAHGAASSQIDIQNLSLTGFSARLRIGDAADPDLVVDRMDVRYDLAGPWSGSNFAFNPRSINFVRPRLKARLEGGVLRFGALDGVIKAIEQLPPTKAPLPDVTVQDGEARLITAGGTVRLHAAGSLRARALTFLHGQIDPFHLAFGADRFDCGGGSIEVESYAGWLKSRIALAAGAYTGADGAVRVAHARLSAETPFPGGAGGWSGPLTASRDAAGLTGPSTASLDAEGLTGTLAGTVWDGGAVNADFEGAMTVFGARQSLSGEVRASGQAASVGTSGVSGRLAAAKVVLSQFTLVNERSGLTARAAVQAGLAVGEIARPGLRLSGLTSQMQSGALTVNTRGGRPEISGVLSGIFFGQGAVRGPSGNGPYAPVLRQALRKFSLSAVNWRLELANRGGESRLFAPLTVTTASGAHVVLTAQAGIRTQGPLTAAGSATLATAGGGLPALRLAVVNATYARGVLAGALSGQGVVDLPPAKGLKFDLTGRATVDRGGGRFSLASCSPVTIDRLVLDPNPATGISARICPSGDPLFGTDRRGWRANGRFESLEGTMPSALAALRGAAGTFVAAGTASGLATATLTVDQAEVRDQGSPIRFAALTGAGHVDVARGVATGAFTVGLAHRPSLASIALRHDLASGIGRADIQAPGVVFAPNGLQPTDLSPLAAVARNAEGPVDFTGWFAWAPAADIKSGGEAVARNFKFASPLGPVVGLNADVRFTSLLPLVTAPDQTLSVNQVQSILPVSALAAKFGLGAENLTLTTAVGSMAKGHIRLEPMRIALAQDAAFKGAIVFDHVNLGEILSATSLSDMVKADAVVDGRIPFEIGPKGITVQQGHLAAVGPGRVSISRKALSGVAAGGGAPDQANFAQDLAYQAMENLAFDQMDATINSQPNDRLGMLFHIKGRHDPPTRQKATLAMKDVLSGHAMDKPMTLPSDTKIDLTLDTSLNFGDLVRAISQAWRDALAPMKAPPHSATVHGPPIKDVHR